ncbi:MAG TPA: hypothetical protein VKE98_03545 [Gemmataceae bacterium]|nr:hypothetical protein [Gemmataceae bacterium]
MATFNCPQCGGPLNEMALSDRRCQSCGAVLPDEAAGQPGSSEEVPQGSQHIGEFDLVPKYLDSTLPLEPTWPEAKIRHGEHGETLAVFALLLPVVVQGVILACHFDSVGIGMALGYGTIAVTALLLAVDAAFMGTTDLHGTQRSSPVALFFGMLLLWIICYPVTFFRRRHFGRPNLGPLALLVAGFFVAVPLLHNFARFGIAGGGVPTCTSREVITMVDDIIRQSPVGPSVRSISDHRETSYDRVLQIRKGQCLVKTQTETITATFSVRTINPKNGTFQVDVDPVIPEDPPFCTDRDVIDHLERVIRAGPNGHLLKSVAGHEEVRYDRENKSRYGRCRVTMQGWTGNVVYKVYWVDRKTGMFQVDIEP